MITLYHLQCYYHQDYTAFMSIMELNNVALSFCLSIEESLLVFSGKHFHWPDLAEMVAGRVKECTAQFRILLRAIQYNSL